MKGMHPLTFPTFGSERRLRTELWEKQALHLDRQPAEVDDPVPTHTFAQRACLDVGGVTQGSRSLR